MHRKIYLFVFAVLPCLLALYFSQPSSAVCVRNPITGREVCHQVLDPTRVIPGSAEVAEQAWGEAGSVAYQASARIMRERNGSGQGLDETQKRFLRQRYGGLVDQVRVAYGSSMMSEWCAAGKCVNLGGVDSAAQTYCDRIYVGDPYKPNDADQLVLLAHEMKHSQQCRERGGEGGFGFHYFREYKRAGQNYANNSMEVDAVNTARDFTRNTICTQVGCTTSVQHYPNYNEWGINLPVSLVAGANQSPITELGFYREGNQAAVYLVFRSNGRYCHVQNSDQMNAFGGFGQVRSISSIGSNSSSGGFSGDCGFPNGFYRLGNQAAVYRLYGSGIPEFNVGNSYCHVANGQQMNAFGGFGQVRSVATTSDLGRGRENTGDCQNP